MAAPRMRFIVPLVLVGVFWIINIVEKAQPPTYDWVQFNTQTVSLEPGSIRAFYQFPPGARVRFQFQSTAPATIALIPDNWKDAIFTNYDPDKLRRNLTPLLCVQDQTLTTTVECQIPNNYRTQILVVEDDRNNASAIKAGIGALFGSGQAVAGQLTPSTVSIVAYRYQCVKNCQYP